LIIFIIIIISFIINNNFFFSMFVLAHGQDGRMCGVWSAIFVQLLLGHYHQYSFLLHPLLEEPTPIAVVQQKQYP